MHKFYIDRESNKRQFQKRNDGEETKDFDVSELEDVVKNETDDVVFFSNWNTAHVMQIHRWNSKDSFTGRVADMEVGSRLRFWCFFILLLFLLLLFFFFF